MRNRILFVVLALLTVAGFAVAQNVSNYASQGGDTWTVGGSLIVPFGGVVTLQSGGSIAGAGSVDMTSGTLRAPSGASPAATCAVGEIFIDTDETVDTNCTTTADNSICVCAATNTWASTE